MKRPSDAHIHAVYEEFERERAAKGQFDNRWAIQRAAEILGLSYDDVRRVVLDRLTARAG